MSKAIPTNIWDNEDLNPITADVIQNHVEGLQEKTYSDNLKTVLTTCEKLKELKATEIRFSEPV